MKDFNEVRRKLNLVYNELRSPSFMQQMARLALKIIYERTKRGYGVSEDFSTRVRLKKLSSGYVKARKGVIEFKTKDGKQVKFKIPKPRLGPFGTPGKSNLTFTGQMLNEMYSKVYTGGFQLSIKNSAREDSDLTNKQVADIVSKERKFFGLTIGEKRIIINEYRKIVNSILKKYF